MSLGLTHRLDYDDYCAIPPDGKRYELIDGDVHVTPAPSPLPQGVVGKVFSALWSYFRRPAEVFISPIDVILTPNDVVQPDVVVVAIPDQVSARGIEGTPLLVIEALSPTTTVYDRAVKSRRYAELGISRYWIVDPASRRLDCYRREASTYVPVWSGGGDERFSSADFAGLELALADFWGERG